MKILITENAEKEYNTADKTLKKLFKKHIKKMTTIPPRKHLKFGLPFNVEQVTKQARIIYKIENNTLYILHLFTTHKEYEKWYKSFK